MDRVALLLDRSRASLVRIGLPAGKRLFEASIPFLEAFSEPKRWPEPVRSQAAFLAQQLTDRGEIYETVMFMLDADAQMLVNDLRRFIDECLLKIGSYAARPAPTALQAAAM